MRKIDRLLYSLVRALPLFAGILLCYYPSAKIDPLHFTAAHGAEYLQRYLLFIIAYALWKIVRVTGIRPEPIKSAETHSTGKGAKSFNGAVSVKGTKSTKGAKPAKSATSINEATPKESAAKRLFSMQTVKTLVFVVSCILFVVLLGEVKFTFGQTLFYLMLSAMALAGSEELLRRKKFYIAAILAVLASSTLTGLVSFAMAGVRELPVLIVFNFAIGCAVASTYCAFLLVRYGMAPTGLGFLISERKKMPAGAVRPSYRSMISQSRYALCFSLLAVLAPTIIVGLCILGPFQRPYSAVYLTLPLVSRLTRLAQNGTPSDKPSSAFLAESTGTSLLFSAIILIVSLLLTP